jgi:hypothetical protein
VYQIVAGYEDCNDADTLRRDPLLKTVCGRGPADQAGFSSQPTLSRFENGVRGASLGRVVRLIEKQYIVSLAPNTDLVVLDIDSTDDRTYGQAQMTMLGGARSHAELTG